MFIVSEVKKRGMADMKANYGLSLLVSIIMMFISGAAAGSCVGGSSGNLSSAGESTDILSGHISNPDPAVLSAIALAVIGVIIAIVLISTVVDILVFNPLIVGCCNFFLDNTKEPAELGSITRGFKPSWFNNVVTMFLKDLFLIFWSFLFIIPGIVKAYSYRLVPYIMAENPELKGTEAITLSRKLMNGNKWKAFCFDLSFIGWALLSAITCGLVGLFYAFPYYYCSDAELYKTIRYGTEIADTVES